MFLFSGNVRAAGGFKQTFLVVSERTTCRAGCDDVPILPLRHNIPRLEHCEDTLLSGKEIVGKLAGRGNVEKKTTGSERQTNRPKAARNGYVQFVVSA